MRLWTKITISTSVVLLCLVASTILTQSFSSIPDRFAYPATTAADATPATAAQNRAEAVALTAQIQQLQAVAAQQKLAAGPAMRDLYLYHSGAENVWVKTVESAPDVSTAVGEMMSVSTALKHDGTVLAKLQQTERRLAADEQRLAHIQHLLKEQGSQHRSQ